MVCILYIVYHLPAYMYIHFLSLYYTDHCPVLEEGLCGYLLSNPKMLYIIKYVLIKSCLYNVSIINHSPVSCLFNG